MAFLCLLFCFALLGVCSGHGDPASQPELSIRPRIINGKDAPPGSWPWHVTLLSQSGFPRCGGSLINRNWVITAAHCNFTRAYRVVIGLHDLRSANNTQELRIAQIFRHPMYNGTTGHNDIALLKLSAGVHFNSKVSPILLPHIDDQFRPRSSCKIMGFGCLDSIGTLNTNQLQEATVTIISNDRCRHYWNDINLDDILCAWGRGVSPSLGDSGGSVACRKNEVWTLAGIMSFGSLSFATYRPFVAIRVTVFLPWIEETLAHN